MAFENRRWLVLPTDKIDDINFDQVLQKDKDSLIKSLDESETFVKYDVTILEEDITTTYIDVETKEEVSYTKNAGTYGRPDVYSADYKEYNHKDMLALLATDEWANNEIE
tara:strand:+ start:51 stop:380 length:330 start_codon:yes stop_codon:yes gene_type:complete